VRSCLFRDLHDDVRRALLIPVGATHRSRPHPLLPGPFIDVGFGNIELIHVKILILVLRVRDRRVNNLLDIGRDPLIDRSQRDDGVMRIRSTTSRAFCGETRMYLASAFASIAPPYAFDDFSVAALAW
jgi:hypothetical protein